MGHKKVMITVLACLSLSAFASAAAQSPTPTPPKPLPNPVLYLVSMEPYTANGKDFIRYRYGVDNLSAYPDEMFAAAPNLPPCGQNPNSSRSWVDFFTSQGRGCTASAPSRRRATSMGFGSRSRLERFRRAMFT